jgi:hypothetical protein
LDLDVSGVGTDLRRIHLHRRHGRYISPAMMHTAATAKSFPAKAGVMFTTQAVPVLKKK